MTWWCSAQGTAWDWSWQPYPGVWLLVLALGLGFGLAVRQRPGGAGHPGSFSLGLLLLWIATDWPVGPLGAGYLASVHMVQYLLLALIVPPLLIHGTPRWVLRRVLCERPLRRSIARVATRPLVAFAVFNTVLLATHLPTVVDTLMRSQLGSFAIDMAWLLSGLVFWWPILAPLEELSPLPYPARLVYLLANVFLPTVPASFLTFADYPIYALYELAPPIGTLSARTDQQVAGLLMKIGGGLILFGTGSVLFFRWFGREGGDGGVK